ncbi:hypothetical protein [Nocardia goodfellowii]|uniref:Uncharacterized protein n=1 Tax=Nocardia goodfellowii TaxID=882446 RepID=A0ABS4QAB3_9NOCA|nr:hypothetical protein [Nocardia goodfellowii]MBP2188642.1 hypothetical protein [Nocardia goodfellowii]
MKLRSLLPRRRSNELPLLPSIEPEDGQPVQVRPTEEKLERLLTPTELDLVNHHQL